MTRDGRVVDLFRDLDLNEDVTVSKREFRQRCHCLPVLPTASRRDIDLPSTSLTRTMRRPDQVRRAVFVWLRNFASERRVL